MLDKEDIYNMAKQLQNFSLFTEKYFTSEHSELVEYFSPQEEKLRVSKWPCYVLFIPSTPMKHQTI